MQIKQLNKVMNIYEEIKEIDAEIVKLDKTALMIANEGGECSFEMKIVGPKKEEAIAVKEKETGGFIIPSSFFASYLRYAGGEKEEEEKETTKLQCSLPDTVALSILGFLLRNLNDKREALIGRLTKLGVAI